METATATTNDSHTTTGEVDQAGETRTQRIGIIMNGVTGRMGTNQHLLRSICSIMEDGGVPAGDDAVIMPDPVLVGRNTAKLERLSERSGIEAWTTDLDAVLTDERYGVYFDALSTHLRYEHVKRALEAGKHVYCEKPVALTTEEALDLYRRAEEQGVKHGVVQDKLWLPGLRKIDALRRMGFFGEMLSVRGEFGYWVFTGEDVAAQRPSWNYRAEEGGGIILDMLCHWRYILDNLFGAVQSVSCLGATHVSERWDESGERYEATADDAAYATFELEGGVVAQFNSSWATRVRRDDLLTVQVDGTKGSAVAGLRTCYVQPLATTPRPVWNPDVKTKIDYRDQWTRVPDQQGAAYENAFKAQWKLFLRHVAGVPAGRPYTWDLLEGAKGVQLAEKGYASSEKRAWVDVPDLV